MKSGIKDGTKVTLNLSSNLIRNSDYEFKTGIPGIDNLIIFPFKMSKSYFKELSNIDTKKTIPLKARNLIWLVKR